MIERNKYHQEKQKLSDKFQQPFTHSDGRELVSMFNAKNQNNRKGKLKRKFRK